jgi:hypothetical protein
MPLPNTPFGGTTWRDFDGEEQMTGNDWQARKTQYQIGKLCKRKDDDCNPDSDGIGTFGCYNGDWSDDDHAAYNKLLAADPKYAAKINGDLEKLRRLAGELEKNKRRA